MCITLLTAHCSLLTAHCSLLTAHCSLLTSVINASYKPLLGRQVAIDATEHFAFFGLWIDYCDIPFVPRPNICAPPITRAAPGTASAYNLTPNSAAPIVTGRIDSHWFSISRAHIRAPWGPKHSQTDHTLPISDCGLRIRMTLLSRTRYAESVHAKRSRPMSV